MWQTSEKNYFSNEFANVWNIATGAGLRTHGCFWSSGSSRACTRPSHQVGGGKYPQAKIFANIHDDAGNCRKKCVKITFHWSKYLGSTPWLESPNVQVVWDLGSQHLQEDQSISTGKLAMMNFVVSLKVWVNGWIDAIIYHYQDCNELALLLLGSGICWKWNLWSNSEVTTAELEPYNNITCGGTWTIFSLNDKSTFGQLWYIDDKSWTIALPRTVCDELLGPMVFNTVDSRAKELGGNP